MYPHPGQMGYQSCTYHGVNTMITHPMAGWLILGAPILMHIRTLPLNGLGAQWQEFPLHACCIPASILPCCNTPHASACPCASSTDCSTNYGPPLPQWSYPAPSQALQPDTLAPELPEITHLPRDPQTIANPLQLWDQG